MRVSKLNIIYFNARSINNKVVELQALLADNEYDIVFVTETWLKSYHKDSYLCSNFDYFVVRSDRHNGERGGAVCAFVKFEFSKQVNVINAISEGKEFDIIALDLHLERNKILRFVCAYLPPDSTRKIDIVSKFLATLNHIVVFNYTYIFGDFNFSKIVWNRDGNSYPSQSNESNCFLNFLSKHSFVQLVNEPTHSSGNILDLIIAPKDNEITLVSILEPFTLSCDHNMINVVFTIPKWQKTSFFAKKNFYKANYCAINDFLRTVNWEEVLNEDSIESNYSVFIDILQQTIQCYTPDTAVRKKSFVPKHLKALRIQKKKLYRLSKTNRDAKDEYRRIEKLYKKSARKYFNSLEEKVVSSGCKKNFFNYVNRKLKSKTFIPPLVDPSNDQVVTNAEDKAELLNTLVTQRYQNNDSKFDQHRLPRVNVDNEMAELLITEVEILQSIKRMKSSVSRTPENIPAIFVKRTGMNLLHPLKILFQQSLSQGIIPTSWGKSLIVPVFKKGLRSNAKNYRPVAQTSVFGRLLEGCIYQRTYHHLKINNILSFAQHGFVEKRSTMTNQLLTLDCLEYNYDRRVQTDMILLDFSKAFDLVPHNKLIEVLKSYHVHRDAIAWIKALLGSRTQQTVVDNEYSNSTTVSSGVPQGSVIGPLLFNIYINSLLKSLESINYIFVAAFADDIKIISSNPTVIQKALECGDLVQKLLFKDQSIKV